MLYNLATVAIKPEVVGEYKGVGSREKVSAEVADGDVDANGGCLPVTRTED